MLGDIESRQKIISKLEYEWNIIQVALNLFGMSLPFRPFPITNLADRVAASSYSKANTGGNDVQKVEKKKVDGSLPSHAQYKKIEQLLILPRIKIPPRSEKSAENIAWILNIVCE